MARTISTLSAGLAAAAVLAACSSSSNSGGGSALATHRTSVGTVLADASGKTLYTAEQEADGTIRCTGACLQFWKPVTGTSTSAPSVVSATIATTKRSDGPTQLTYNGAPLYTFVEDTSPGDAKGNDFKDAFGSNHFTWHAVIVTPSTGGASTSSGGGYGGGGGGY